MDKYIEFDIDSNKTSGHRHRKREERQNHMIDGEYQPDKKIVPLLDKSIKSFSILPEK
jgi:hypothetical protein